MEQFTINKPVFGNWFVKRKIGEGSIGTVYEIECDEFGQTRHAALKVIRVPKSENDIKDALRNGISEAELKNRINRFLDELLDKISTMYKMKGSANIVQYEEHTVLPHSDGIGWDVLIRMEKLTPLPDYFALHQPNQRSVINLGIDICRALEFCLKRNIIHTDIRPSNIFVSDSGDYKLGDFGISSALKNNLSFFLQESISPYIAPEIYSGKSYDLGADIYSLGVILYQYLNFDRTPFLPAYPQGVSREDRETAALLCVQGKRMPPPSGASGDLSDIILTACAYSPSNRYGDPALFRDDLYAMLVLMGKNGEKVPDYPEDSDDVPSPEDNSSQPSSKKKRSIIIAATALVVCALVVAIAAFFGRNNDNKPIESSTSQNISVAGDITGESTVSSENVTEIVTDSLGNIIKKTEYTPTGKIVTQAGFDKELMKLCTYVHTYSKNGSIIDTRGTCSDSNDYFEISYYSDGPKLDLIFYKSADLPAFKYSYSKPDESGRATARNDFTYDSTLKVFTPSGSAQLEYDGSGISKITEYDIDKNPLSISEFSGESLLRKTVFSNGVKTAMREYYITPSENIGAVQRLTEYMADGSYTVTGYDALGNVSETFVSQETTTATSTTTDNSSASLEPVPRSETTTSDRFREGISRFADWLF